MVNEAEVTQKHVMGALCETAQTNKPAHANYIVHATANTLYYRPYRDNINYIATIRSRWLSEATQTHQ